MKQKELISITTKNLEWDESIVGYVTEIDDEYFTINEIDINKIDKMVSAIKKQYRKQDSNISDTWGGTLVINNKIFYEVDDFSFKLLPDEIKNLINYLVSLSAIKIDLYRFS